MRITRLLITVTVFCLLLLQNLGAQTQISGQVSDIKTKVPLSNVQVHNVHTGRTVIADSAGRFSLEVGKGELLEFQSPGYQVQRLRIPEGATPPYYKIFLEETPGLAPEYIAGGRRGIDWKADSLHYYETYKQALNFPQFSTLDAIKHPFSAMSKHNRQIWAFQKEYSWFEKEKYVDYTFNERVVANLTGMSEDSAKAYVSMYRPSYDQLRSMSEYDFYKFIRVTVDQFRAGYNPRRPMRRGSQ